MNNTFRQMVDAEVKLQSMHFKDNDITEGLDFIQSKINNMPSSDRLCKVQTMVSIAAVAEICLRSKKETTPMNCINPTVILNDGIDHIPNELMTEWLLIVKYKSRLKSNLNNNNIWLEDPDLVKLVQENPEKWSKYCQVE